MTDRWVLVAAALALAGCSAGAAKDESPGSPPDPTERAKGVIVTPSGVVAPFFSAFAQGRGHWVRTPCWRMEPVLGGRVVDSVDVVVDPGHGGAELGAVDEATAREEKELNLDVAERLAADLVRSGYTVQLTRTTDTWMTIRTRAEIGRALRPKVLVSVHHNSGGSGTSPEPGSEVYFQMHSPRARDLAELVYTNISFAFSRYPIAWRDNPDRGARIRSSDENPDRDAYGVLRYSIPIPAVLTEGAFVTGPEADLLARDDVRAAEALGIANAVRSFLGPPPVRELPPVAGSLPPPTAAGTTRPDAGAATGSTTPDGRTYGWPRITLPNGEPTEEPFPSTPPADQVDCVEPKLT